MLMAALFVTATKKCKHLKCSAITGLLVFHMHMLKQHKAVKLNEQELYALTWRNLEKNGVKEVNFRVTHTVYYLTEHKSTILYYVSGKLSM